MTILNDNPQMTSLLDYTPGISSQILSLNTISLIVVIREQAFFTKSPQGGLLLNRGGLFGPEGGLFGTLQGGPPPLAPPVFMYEQHG